MIPRTSFATFLLAGTLCAAAAGPAAAQVSDVDRATARALALEGDDALVRKDHAAAADRFTRADALIHAPTLLLGLARAQIGLGRWVAAQETCSRIVREGVAPGAPPVFSKAVESAQQELDTLGPRLPRVTLRVNGPPGVKVTVDGVAVPAAAFGVKRPMDPGRHLVRASIEGGAPVEVEVVAIEGRSSEVMLDVKAPPPGAAAPPAGSGRRIAGVAALGVGGAGIVLGAVTGALAVVKHADLGKVCVVGGRCPRQYASDVDTYNTLATVSTVGLAVGGAAAATGAILLLTAPRPRREASVVPLIGPGYVGVAGRFQ